jgi:hypothetical protein
MTSSRHRGDINVRGKVMGSQVLNLCCGLGSFFVDDILYRVIEPFDEIAAPVFLSLERTG